MKRRKFLIRKKGKKNKRGKKEKEDRILDALGSLTDEMKKLRQRQQLLEERESARRVAAHATAQAVVENKKTDAVDLRKGKPDGEKVELLGHEKRKIDEKRLFSGDVIVDFPLGAQKRSADEQGLDEREYKARRKLSTAAADFEKTLESLPNMSRPSGRCSERDSVEYRSPLVKFPGTSASIHNKHKGDSKPRGTHFREVGALARMRNCISEAIHFCPPDLEDESSQNRLNFWATVQRIPGYLKELMAYAKEWEEEHPDVKAKAKKEKDA